jgi:hypothetical protein
MGEIQDRFGFIVDEEELISTVVMRAPTDYDGVITAVQHTATCLGKDVTLEDLEEATTRQWRKRHGLKAKEEESETHHEITAAGVTNNGGRKCFECGGDHFKRNCPKLKGEQKVCTRCGKKGHEDSKCWHNPANAASRPSWFTVPTNAAPPTEVTNICHDSEVEILCSMVTTQLFPKDIKLLEDKNIWIGDTAATVDMTRYATGMQDLKTTDTMVRGVNGDYAKPKQVGSLKTMMCT